MNKPVLLLLVLLIATIACAHKGQHHGGHRPHDGNPHKGQHHGSGEGHGPHDGQHHPGGGKGNHHHNGEHKPHLDDGHQDSCTYTNTKGEEFDFRALTSYLKDQDWKLISSETRSVFHFNPCGHVRVKACPSNSSLCEITKDGKAISFGSVHQAMWADGESAGANVEITYGGGDMCSNGVTRKTVVDLKCEEFAVEEDARPSHVVAVHEEECMVKLLIESPYACPKADVCSFLKDSKSCHNTDGMCSWRHDACTARRNWFRDFTLKHHLTNPVIFTLLVSGSFVTSCLLATCMCCLCKKRNNRAKLVAKKNKVESCKMQDFKQVEADHAVVSIPTEAPYLYQPMHAVNGENSFFVPPVATGYPAAAYSYPMVQMVPAHLLHHHQQQMDSQKQQH